MIYCPECGTANRDGSKFCNDCGARLDPDQGKRCPMCGHSNPQDAEVCKHCEARLTPLRLGDAAEMPGTADQEREEESPEVVIEPEFESDEMAAKPSAAEPADWLQRLRQTAMGGAGEEEPLAVLADEDEGDAWEAETPEWMSSAVEGTEALLEEESGVSDVTPPLVRQSGPTPLPDWLEELVASEEDEGALEGERGPVSDQSSPAWLHGIAADADESPLVGGQDDLGAIWSASRQDDDLSPAFPADADDEIETPGPVGKPGWLFDEEESELPELSLVDDMYEGFVPEQAPASGEEREEGWGAGEAGLEPVEIESEAWSAPEIEFDSSDEPIALEPDWGLEQAEEPSALADEDIPDWLRDLATRSQPETAEPAESVDVVAGVSEAVPADSPVAPAGLDSDIPDWLRDLAPRQLEEGGDKVDQGLAAAEIPNWLADLRPAPSAEPTPEPEERAEEGHGVLAGIDGILPVESVWRSPQRAQAIPLPPVLTAEEQAAELFADILAGQPEERATSAREEPGFVSRGMTRLIIYLILALAVLVPLFFGADWFSMSIQVPDPTWSLWDAVDALPADSNVVMAFDYDPSVAAELDLQGIALLRHLLEKKARVFALGMVPQGPALAQGVWDTASSGTGSQYGRDFVNLGYLSGQEAGLRKLTEGLGGAFKQDFFQRELAGDAMLRRVQQLQDISLIVILSADKLSAVRWLEQVQKAYPVTMVAGVSATAGPSVLPYYNSGQLSGMLVGMPGAAEYEIAMNQPHTAVSSLGAQSLAHLAIIVIILLGNLTALGNRMRQRK